VEILPWHRPLTDKDILVIVQKTGLFPLFQGVFSRDEIATRSSPPLAYECGIINLDCSSGRGTHWTCWFKHESIVHYYDSFGNLPPPVEFVKFFDKYEVYYNWEREQEYDTFICGHLCLCFLFVCYSALKDALNIKY